MRLYLSCLRSSSASRAQYSHPSLTPFAYCILKQGKRQNEENIPELRSSKESNTVPTGRKKMDVNGIQCYWRSQRIASQTESFQVATTRGYLNVMRVAK